jgi:hypothetical protein
MVGGRPQSDPAFGRAKPEGAPGEAPLGGTGTPYAGHGAGTARHLAESAARAGQTMYRRAGDYAGSASEAARGWGDQFGSLVERYPLAVGGLAMVAGALIALSLPGTRPEDEWLGETSEALRDVAATQGREVISRAEEVAGQAAEAAIGAAKETLKEQAATPGEASGQPRS